MIDVGPPPWIIPPREVVFGALFYDRETLRYVWDRIHSGADTYILPESLEVRMTAHRIANGEYILTVLIGTARQRTGLLTYSGLLSQDNAVERPARSVEKLLLDIQLKCYRDLVERQIWTDELNRPKKKSFVFDTPAYAWNDQAYTAAWTTTAATTTHRTWRRR